MRIRDLPDYDNRRAGAWRVMTDHYDNVSKRRIYHYSTCMLTFNPDDPSDEFVLDYSIGHGSKSDQQGMNQLFWKLGLPLYYARNGGYPRIEER